MSIKVKVDSTDVSEYIQFGKIGNLRVKRRTTEDVSRCSFIMIGTSSMPTPTVNQDVLIEEDSSSLLGGIVENVKETITRGGKYRYDVQVVDYSLQMSRVLINEDYVSDTVNNIIDDLVSNYFSDFTTDNVDCPLTIDSVSFENVRGAEAIRKLADQVNYDFYVDADKDIHFFERGSVSASWGITDTNGNYFYDSLEIETNYNDIKNYVTIEGKAEDTVDPFIVTSSDATSISSYGQHEYYIKNHSIKTTDEAQQLADSYISAWKDPTEEGIFITKKTGLEVGEKIHVESTLRGIDDYFIIYEIISEPKSPFVFHHEVRLKKERVLSFNSFQRGESISISGVMDSLDSHIESDPIDHNDVGSGKLSISARGWSHDLIFSASDYNTLAWDSGTIKLADGTTYNISSGSLDLSAVTYIYLDANVSMTELQTSTDYADSVGDNRILVVVAKHNPETAKKARFKVFGGQEADGIFITADDIASNTITANEIAANTITATEILAGTITGEEISLQTKISIKNTTFGSDGVQLDYNSGNPRAYIGNGSSKYLKFDGTNLSWKAQNTELDTSGNLTASNVTISGSLVAGAGSDVGWSYISNVEVENADIKNGAITNAKIEDATIKNAKIVDLSIGKLTVGNLNVKMNLTSGGSIKSNNYSAGSTGWKIDNNGSAEFQDVTIRGSLNAYDIDAGVLSGIDVQSSIGNNRIVLNNGDYLDFYKGGALKARLRGTTAGNGGLFVENGSDIYIENDNSFFIQDSTGSDTKYGGITIDSDNDFVFIAGTTNDFYWYNNAYNSMIANLNQDGELYVAGIDMDKIDIGITNEYDIIPKTHETGSIGYSNRAWDRLYAQSIFSSDGTVGSYDTHPDIEMVKNIGVKGQKGRNSWDLSGLPDDIQKDGSVNISQLSGLIIGVLKELIGKVEYLEKRLNKI